MDTVELKCGLIISEICKITLPGKKVLQKIFYFIERKGIGLGLNFCIHFYGPYSASLDRILHSLEGNEIIDINTSGATHIISMFPEAILNDQLSEEEKEIVDYVINEFGRKSPLELEALSTIDYAATRLLGGKYTREQVINEVVSIKGTKFDRPSLEREYEVLIREGYVI